MGEIRTPTFLSKSPYRQHSQDECPFWVSLMAYVGAINKLNTLGLPDSP